MRKGLRFWAHVLAWSTSGSLLATFAFGGATLNTPWRILLQRTAVGVVFSSACVALCAFTLPRLVPLTRRRFRFPLDWVVVTMALVGLAMLGCAAGVLVLAAVGHLAVDQMWHAWAASVRTATYFTLLFGIMGTIVHELEGRLERATLVIRTKERDEAEARRLAAEARLASLESRVNPHFLFNTLNSIAALTHSNPAAAERMTNQLAALMRSSLDAATAPLVSLEEEVKLVRDYLEIERVRFDRRLQYTIDISSAAFDTRVPRLALQTVVENSIKYAVSSRREGGHVDIRAETTNGATRIQIKDDGPGFDGRMPEGHGLSLVKSRLMMTFGEQATLDVDSRPGGTCVTLTVPQPA